jgi:hypothetical protein
VTGAIAGDWPGTRGGAADAGGYPAG